MVNPKFNSSTNKINSDPPATLVDLTGGKARSVSAAKKRRVGGGDFVVPLVPPAKPLPGIEFSLGILIESDGHSRCFSNNVKGKMQDQHRFVTKTVPSDGSIINLGSLISDAVVQAWMERNNQQSNEAFSVCAYKPASKSANDKHLVAITETSSTSAAPGKKIGFSKCGNLFSAKFTTDDLSKLVAKMKDKEPQFYLGICALAFPVDDSSPIRVISPNSHNYQTRQMARLEGNNMWSIYL